MSTTSISPAVPEPPDDLSVPTPPRPSATPGAPKEIATLPPLPVIAEVLSLSERTGEPRRHPLIVASVVTGYLSGAATTGMYALSWWQAAHQDSFAGSAQLLTWVNPPPGKWLALTLVAVLGAVAALMVAAPAVVAYNAWAGQRWTRIGGLIATAIVVIGTVLFSPWGWIAVGLAAISSVLLWLPPATQYFRQWQQFRWHQPTKRRAETPIMYGPLARYR